MPPNTSADFSLGEPSQDVGNGTDFYVDNYQPTQADIVALLERAAEELRPPDESGLAIESVMNQGDEAEALKDERNHKPTYFGVRKAFSEFHRVMAEALRISKRKVGKQALDTVAKLKVILTARKAELTTADYEDLVDNLEVATHFVEILLGQMHQHYKEATGSARAVLSRSELPYSPYQFSFRNPPRPFGEEGNPTESYRRMLIRNIIMNPVLKDLD